MVHFSEEPSRHDQVALTLDLEDLLGVSVYVISDGAAGVNRRACGSRVTPHERNRRGIIDTLGVADEYGFIDYRIVWRALSDVLPKDVASI